MRKPWLIPILFFSIILLVVVGPCLLFIDAAQKTMENDYTIEVLVPEQVVLVKILGNRNSTEVLQKGIREVGKKYNMKNGAPIIEYGRYATFTKAFVLFVEPKK